MMSKKAKSLYNNNIVVASRHGVGIYIYIYIVRYPVCSRVPVDRVKYFHRENSKPFFGSDQRLVVINYYIILSLQYDRDREERDLGCASGRAHARTAQDGGLSEERLEINLKPEEGGFFSEKNHPIANIPRITVQCVSPGFGSGKRITQNRVRTACVRADDDALT